MKSSPGRRWTGAETRLVAEYLPLRWPGRRHLQRVRVGRIPSELPTDALAPEELRMLGVWRRWVDAMVVDPPVLWVIEAGVVPDPGDISRLGLYLRLLPDTPELSDLLRLRPRGRLLYAVDDPVLARMAVEAGYEYEVWTPSWVPDYLRSRRPAHRRAPLSQG